MSNELSLPQNGLRVGNQLVAEGDNLSLGYNVGVANNLRVGNTVYANRVASPFVTVNHAFNDRNVTIDCNYQTHNVILNANTTGLTFTNVPPAGDGAFLITVYFNQDRVGSRSIVWNTTTNIRWPNTGTSTGNPIYPSLQTLPNRVDVFQFVTFDGGTNWIGYQQNPVGVQLTDLLDVQYAIRSWNNNPSALSNATPYSGTIVQTKVVTSTAATDFSTVNYTDLLTMTFYPKYPTTRLLLMADIKHGNGSTSFSTHFMFTVGTNPITGTNILSTLGTGTNTTNDVSQNAHCGGYEQAVDSNHVNFKHGNISFLHNVPAGSALDLRIRGRHADAWSDQSIVLNRSWGFPNGSYSASNTSSFTVMEYLE